ncbi:MAG TPA: hypothetical protein VGH44_01335 [Candidatus Saccharimonadia bacterium]|jgi:hypothetical protein
MNNKVKNSARSRYPNQFSERLLVDLKAKSNQPTLDLRGYGEEPRKSAHVLDLSRDQTNRLATELKDNFFEMMPATPLAPRRFDVDGIKPALADRLGDRHWRKAALPIVAIAGLLGIIGTAQLMFAPHNLNTKPAATEPAGKGSSTSSSTGVNSTAQSGSQPPVVQQSGGATVGGSRSTSGGSSSSSPAGGGTSTHPAAGGSGGAAGSGGSAQTPSGGSQTIDPAITVPGAGTARVEVQPTPALLGP